MPNLTWRVIIKVNIPQEPLKNLTRSKWNYATKTLNPTTPFPPCERCRNRAGKGWRGRWLVPYALWAQARRKHSLHWAPGGQAQRGEFLRMQCESPWPWCWLRSGSLPTTVVKSWEPVTLRERVGVCRLSVAEPPRVQRVSADHEEHSWGVWCSEFDMNWAQWCARKPPLQKTKTKSSICSVYWFLWCKNSHHSQFQVTNGLKIGSKNSIIFSNWFQQAGGANSSKTPRHPSEGWTWHLRTSPENYYKYIMSHFL